MVKPKDCTTCRHLNNDKWEYPCNQCLYSHHIKDLYEEVKFVNIETLIKKLQRIPNQQISWPTDYKLEDVLKDIEHLCIVYD